MARTSATRIGRGKGHGGPATGPGRGPASGKPAKAFAPDNQPPPEAKAAGQDVAAEIRARIAARRHEILAAQLERATDTTHPQGHQAAADLLNRVMPPVSVNVNQTVRTVIRAPAEPKDLQEWQAQHLPKHLNS